MSVAYRLRPVREVADRHKAPRNIEGTCCVGAIAGAFGVGNAGAGRYRYMRAAAGRDSYCPNGRGRERGMWRSDPPRRVLGVAYGIGGVIPAVFRWKMIEHPSGRCWGMRYPGRWGSCCGGEREAAWEGRPDIGDCGVVVPSDGGGGEVGSSFVRLELRIMGVGQRQKVMPRQEGRWLRSWQGSGLEVAEGVGRCTAGANQPNFAR